MTKVLPCYSLCPLIEQKSFLGITPDVKSDTVIVTTNSNIIGRYRISDPKEISSWNSKGSISCNTVYDSFDQQYVTIFNSNEIRKWARTDKSIDKVKKFKFSEKLHSLSVSPENGRTLVIFEKGHVRYLTNAIEDRKSNISSSWITDGEKLSTFEVVSISNQIIAVLLVQKSDKYRILGVAVNQMSLIFDLPVENSSRLCGHCIVADKSCNFISLWSDGKLYRDSIYPNAMSLPSNIIATFDLDLEQPVVMKALSTYNVAICGSKDDGLLLLIFSIKYNSIQCKQFYENCPNPPQLWCINSKLFMIMGHNLVVVPYVQENRKLSTLIGSNHHVDENVAELLPESKICRDSFPLLLEKNEDDKIREMLLSHYDVPDSVLLNILTWSLKDTESRCDILGIILNNYCPNLTDVSQLRSVCSVDKSIFVLDHVMNSLLSNENSFKLLKWASLFIDAFYQQCVMSDDQAILDKLSSYFSILMKEKEYINEFVQLGSVLSCVQRKKVILTT